jgi:putative transposase
MKKSRFTESQIVAILKEGEAGVAVAQLTRKHGISAATYYHWKSKYGGAAVSELKRLRELEAENAKLKRMYADLALENTAIKDVLSRNIWSAPDLQEPCSDERDSLRKYIRPLASQGRLVPRP